LWEARDVIVDRPARPAAAAVALALLASAGVAVAKPSAKTSPKVVDPGKAVYITAKGLPAKTRYKGFATLIGFPQEAHCLYQQFKYKKTDSKGTVKIKLPGTSKYNGTWCRGRKYRVEFTGPRILSPRAKTGFHVTGTVPPLGG
jgi:hypothetical protein